MKIVKHTQRVFVSAYIAGLWLIWFWAFLSSVFVAYFEIFQLIYIINLYKLESFKISNKKWKQTPLRPSNFVLINLTAKHTHNSNADIKSSYEISKYIKPRLVSNNNKPTLHKNLHKISINSILSNPFQF